MRKLVCSAVLSLFLYNCENKPKTNYVIDGKAEGVYNGMRVYLSKYNERGASIPIDTAIVMNEKFSFTGKLNNPEYYFVTMNGTKGTFPIMLENGNMALGLDSKLITNSSFKGSKSHDIYSIFNSKMTKIKDDLTLARINLNQTILSKDSAKIQKAREELNALTEDYTTYPYEYIENNIESYAILPIFKLIAVAKDADYERLMDLYNKLSDNLKTNDTAVSVKTLLDERIKRYNLDKITAIGAKAPDFSAPNPDGKTIALKDVVSKGKITIIDFWAAWCGPCRRENPNVVKVYNKYHDKGLEIIGVGLDGRRGQKNPKEAWIKAIKDDNLNWHHVSKLNYFGDIAKAYNVNSIPRMFVLDSDGKIVAKNLRGKALELKIDELLR